MVVLLSARVGYLNLSWVVELPILFLVRVVLTIGHTGDDATEYNEEDAKHRNGHFNIDFLHLLVMPLVLLLERVFVAVSLFYAELLSPVDLDHNLLVVGLQVVKMRAFVHLDAALVLTVLVLLALDVYLVEHLRHGERIVAIPDEFEPRFHLVLAQAVSI